MVEKEVVHKTAHIKKNTSVILYLLLKNDAFPISLPFPLYQGNTLVNFLTAYKRLWDLCILVEASGSKKPELNYCLSFGSLLYSICPKSQYVQFFKSEIQASTQISVTIWNPKMLLI